MKLSKQALAILEELKTGSPITVSQLEDEGYDQSMVNRAALELEEKGLATFEEEEEFGYELTEEGKDVLENGSPEYQLIQRLEDGPEPISELQDLPIDIALGKARQNGWVSIEDGEVSLTDQGVEALKEDMVRTRLEEEDYDKDLEERGLIESLTDTKRIIEITEEGEEIDLNDIEEEFNVEAKVETPRTGKKHFYKEIIDYARNKWMEMGFEEMSGDYVVSSFINFDALYTPQDHPARELQDTFFMENPEAANLDEYGDKVGHVEMTHQHGWETGGQGWRYDWNREEAEQNVLRTHTTAISAQKLHEIDINEEELPKKYYIVGRNFRNETVDRHHLAEFLQTDGIVVGKDLNFRNLKAYITEFFHKMGYDEIRLVPSFYPYTEMSVEVQVYDDESGEWMGLGGAGMFRPEVVKPMLGFEASVLAWGLGIPRIAMGAAELSDIRELYRNDLEILEETPVWRPE